MRWLLIGLRWVLPALIALTGVAIAVAGGGSDISIEGAALFLGAAFAVVVVNVLVRIGIEGDVSREREEAARRYFDEHGHWPDQRPRGS